MTIYTDGGGLSKPKLGAAGFWVPSLNHKEVVVIANVTNNYVELYAFALAVKFAQRHQSNCTIVSDSLYVVDGYNTYMHDWYPDIHGRKNGELWAIVWDLKLTYGNHITVRHCRGHGQGTKDSPKDVAGNDFIDRLLTKTLKIAKKSLNLPPEQET